MKQDMRLPFEKGERSIIRKRDFKSDSNYGCDPFRRPVEELLKYGVVNIDKPKGPTSHQVSAYVQQILGLTKAGHSGTLDPSVTGCLPVALGRATRIVQTLLTAGKEYVAIMHVHKPIEDYMVYQVAEKFTGKIRQMPPIKSAVKRQYRERTVYYLKIHEIKDQDVLFRVGCEAGTYIRKLIHDMGKELGGGAHMAELRRTKAGPFTEDENLCSLQDLADAFYYWAEEKNDAPIRRLVRPMELAVSHLPKIWITDSTIDAICHGADLAAPGIAELHSGIEPDQLVALMSMKGELVAYGRASCNGDKMLDPKGIVVKTMKVFMEPGVYPKFEKT
ncbi:MAG: RNA-guided pseudouridylation complex pseudouridine synthase subunit Cbf5 [Candidatus Woesearchaeota archaeon]